MTKLSKISVVAALMVSSSGALAACSKGHTHEYEHHDSVASTCLEKGRAEYYSCKGCELIFDAEKVETTLDELVLPLGSHALEHHDAKLPQCEVPGNIEYWNCTVCEKMFSDENAKTVITDPSVTKGHSYGSWVPEVESTCIAHGSKGYYHCEDCGKYFDENKNEVTEASLVLPFADHKSDGVWGYDDEKHWTTCTVCSQKINENHKHKYVLSEDGGLYEDKCACGHKDAGHADIKTHTDEKASLSQFEWDETDGKYVVKTGFSAALPTLPAGTTLKKVAFGGSEINGAALVDGSITLPNEFIEANVGNEGELTATVTVGEQDLAINAEIGVVTAEIATIKQFSFVRWTNEANNGTTKSSGDHPFVKSENGKNYIGGHFVLTADLHKGEGTIDERSGDFGYAGNLVNSGWDQLKGFRGTFDGKGHAFDDITFISYGLFGAIGKGGIVKNFDITCTNGYSTRVHNSQPYACSIASQVYNARIENVNGYYYGAESMDSAGNYNALVVGDMIDVNSVVKDCYFKTRCGAKNVFGTRTTGAVIFENVTIEVFKQWSSDSVYGIVNYYGGNSDNYPACTETPAGITLVQA